MLRIRITYNLKLLTLQINQKSVLRGLLLRMAKYKGIIKPLNPQIPFLHFSYTVLTVYCISIIVVTIT